MKHKKIKEQHDKLEQKIMSVLRQKILKSKTSSKFMDTPVIKVNVFNYVELAILNDHLTFLDAKGFHYSIYADCSLEDLVDILTQL